MYQRLSSSVGPLLVAGSLAALGCSSPGADPDLDAAGSASRELRLYVFDCGTLRVGDVSAFGLTLDDVATTELFVPCYLVDHPEGRLVWDAGLPLDVLSGERVMEGVELTLERPLEQLLAEIGVAPAEVDFAAFSHFHFDHVGQANLFAASTHLIQAREHEAAFAEPPAFDFYERDLYSALASAETQLLDGDHDVFGDGRVVIKSAPGHTPGHQVLFVDLEKTGPILLSGDLYHFPANRELGRFPLFNADQEQTLETAERIEAFLAESGAQLWIEHDAILAQELRKAPEFHR